MATIRILLGILCFTPMLSYRLSNRNLLNAEQIKLIGIAKSQVGIRESKQNNHGKAVSAYLKYTNLPEGHPWCAAFISWIYAEAGYSRPKTAWSPALFSESKLVKNPVTGDVFGVFCPKLKRIAHCGLVERINHEWIITIEGNTNSAASRDGDGVYRKWRHIRTIYAFARWLPKRKGVGDE